MMEQKDIFSFIDKFEQSGLTRMEIRDGSFSLKLENQPAVAAVAALAPAAPAPVEPAHGPSASAAAETAIPASDNLVVVRAPLVGVFYAAPAPDQPPYVKVGDRVKAGQVLCLVEAMKMMNELQSPVDGIIRSAGGTNGELVEFDQMLFEVEPC